MIVVVIWGIVLKVMAEVGKVLDNSIVEVLEGDKARYVDAVKMIMLIVFVRVL